MLSPKKEKTEKVKLTKDSYRKAKGIFSYLKPYAFVYFIGWVFLVLSTSAGLVFPYLMGKLLGAGGSKTTSSGTIDFISMENINSIALSLFILFAFQALFSFVRVVIFNNVTENALRDIRNDAFEKLVYMPMDFFNKSKVGELTSYCFWWHCFSVFYFLEISIDNACYSSCYGYCRCIFRSIYPQVK
jgi:ABC-type multidrug transport system fused ATPase/permease subunit